MWPDQRETSGGEEDDLNTTTGRLVYFWTQKEPLLHTLLKWLKKSYLWDFIGLFFHHLCPGRSRWPGCSLASLHCTPCTWAAGSRCRDLALFLHPAPSELLSARDATARQTPISPSSPRLSPPGPAAAWSPPRPGRIGSRRPESKGQEPPYSFIYRH